MINQFFLSKIVLVGLAFSLISASDLCVFPQMNAPFQKTTDLPKEIARKLKRDAARLALRLESDKEDLRYLSIFIPKSNSDQLFTALSGLYLGDLTAQKLEKCNLHTFPNPSIDHCVLIYDKNIEWARPLLQGINETNSPRINELLDKYNLTIEKHVNWTDSEDAITIRSRDPLNMAAIANEFNNIDGVKEIDLGVPKILGNDIVARRSSGGWDIDYVLRFGSWSAGKGKQHVWKYRVSDSAKIQFLGESGDEVPSWMQCSTGKADDFASKG
jgi:hypothetical protein